MGDAHVTNGATATLGRVEGQLKVGHNARVRTESGILVVTGGAEFQGSAVVEGDLECHDLRVERSGRLRVEGNLTVADTIDVSNSIEVTGTMTADSIDVGGRVNARSISCQRMRVGGTAEVLESLTADSVDVGGKIEAPGTVNIKNLQVGGKAEIGGGSITGTVNISGKFDSSSKLEFGELKVFGTGTLASGSRGNRVVVSGKLEARGDLQCDQIEIHGMTAVSGDCNSSKVIVSGKLNVSGGLSASTEAEVHGIASVSKELRGGNLRVEGRLSAEKAILENEVMISGASETQRGLKARSVVIQTGTRCSGPIVAETVDIGSSGPTFTSYFFGQRLRVQAGTSRVEDVYASRVVIGTGSRARRIFAETVELESGCDVDEVTYVKEIKLGDHVRIAHPVKKVEKIQEPVV